MSGLDLKRLDSIRLTPRPILQRVVATTMIWPSYHLYPGVRVNWENAPNLGPGPVILAANHTDRYNYFPLLFRWWRDKGRFAAAWMKGKYYENPLLGAVMSRLGTLPTVSRGYIVLRDVRDVLKRAPTDAEYREIRHWMENPHSFPPVGALPQALLATPRNILGRDFDPTRESYGAALAALYAEMMGKFVALHEKSFALGRDLLIFPQGTRSVRLSQGRPGIGQIALHFKLPILPVGVSGSDRVYPGNLPIPRRGTVTLRFGEPITYEDLAPWHTAEPFVPFTPEAERAYRANFQGVADLVMDRINALVDPEYRFSDTKESDGEAGAKRFL